jgi:hypothetical protein
MITVFLLIPRFAWLRSKEEVPMYHPRFGWRLSWWTKRRCLLGSAGDGTRQPRPARFFGADILSL